MPVPYKFRGERTDDRVDESIELKLEAIIHPREITVSHSCDQPRYAVHFTCIGG